MYRRYVLLGAILGLGLFLGVSAGLPLSQASTSQQGYHAGAGVTYSAVPGPNVTLGQNETVSSPDAWPQPRTVRFTFPTQDLALSITSPGSPHVYLSRITGAAITTSLAGSQSTTLAVSGSHPVVAGPHISRLRIATTIKPDDQTNDLTYTAGKPATLSIQGLPSGVPYRFVAPSGQTIVNGTTNGDGTLTVTVPARSNQTLALEAIGGSPSANPSGSGVGGLSLFGLQLPGGFLGVLLAFLVAGGYVVYKHYTGGQVGGFLTGSHSKKKKR